MIVASHQPNFLPYMGYFYKMYVCDVFTFSDTVQFSRSGFHNYNFIDSDSLGGGEKITIPVRGKTAPINEVLLSDWYHYSIKIWKRLKCTYSHSPFYKQIYRKFEAIFEGEYIHLSQLNIDLIKLIYELFEFDCKLINESDLNISGKTATQQIADICQKTGCDTYLSGTGAKDYLDVPLLNQKGVSVLWSNYSPLQYNPVKGENLSVIDYLMEKGAHVPDQWKRDKEVLICGK